VLEAALQRLAPAEGSREQKVTLTLPSSPSGPQASPQLLRTADDGAATDGFDRRSEWTAPALAVPTASLLELLLALPSEPVPGVRVGDSLRFLAEVAKLALELVARGRLRPELARRAEDWIACWRPVTEDPDDGARVRTLTGAMPGLLAAARGGSAGTVVHAVLGAIIDATGRELLRDVTATADDVAGAWLSALAAEDPVVRGNPWELATLAEQLDDWWREGERYAAQRMFRTCFRLAAPDEDDEPWRVEILLQSKEDPSVLVPAADVWTRSERLTALGRMLENPQERLLGGLGHALALWPDLEPALREATPTEVELTTDGAHRFLHDAAPALQQAGFTVLAPAWWSERLRVSLSMTPEAEWGDSTGLFGLEGLCAYQWRVAIGGATLSFSELRALAELKVPLVRARGRWIALHPEDVEAALRFPERRAERGRAPAGELLRQAVGLDGASRASDEPEIDIEARGWIGELLGASGDRKLELMRTPRSFAGELRPYQQRGLAWLAFLSSVRLGACLADDMGLGKTIQLLALLLAEREGAGPRPGPTLLICPTSVAGNWQREAARFAPSMRVHLHYGRDRLRDAPFTAAAAASDLVITTYALALRDSDALSAVSWERVALDEAQSIKTIDAKQTRAVRRLKARHRVAMTGTPVENRLSELHSIMDFLNPGLLGSATGFQERFAHPIERYRDGSATRRLRQVTGPFILRRLKTDRNIVSDLPEKIETRVDCHLTREQATLYQAVVDEMLERCAEVTGIARAGIVLAALMKLKQVCNHPAQLLKDRSELRGRSGKLIRLEEILDEVLATDGRALCFTQFATFGHQLHAHLQERFGREALFLHGGTPKAARDEMVTRFQREDGPALFILSLKAGGTGLNLTSANHVVHFDRWWNPAVEDQATDRAFRIGQRRNVQVHKLSCVGTLEERIDRLISEKKALAHHIVGDGEAWLTELDTAELRELVTLSAEAVAA